MHKKKCLAKDKFTAAPGAGANPPLAHCVDFSRDGSMVATAVGDGSIVLSSWKQLKRTTIFAQKHAAAACSVCFLRNGKLVVSGGLDEAVMLWNATIRGAAAATATPIQRWDKQGKVNWIASHPTQDAFFVASRSDSIHMFIIR